ncbi:MAG: nicotinate phosphoribosyltransferase [Deltaproteobacteria bacterium]|nr:nicotinate phosphoribosyltransferase [Deltaproteobacteria bacterium]
MTDLYQLTMAYAYWRAGVHEREAVFHLYFRKNPFGGGFSVACGTERAAEYVAMLSFDGEDLEYLATVRGVDGGRLFPDAFLDYLEEASPALDVDAIKEGTPVFPQEPLVRVRGPVLWGQLVETPLLNFVNFETLIATKAARVCRAAGEAPVLEFGLRRAQGVDGGLSASRAAYIGGCAATSNVLAGRLFGVPVRGTHAHSWVMFFDGEREAFERYSTALPNNCIFLVDTYDTVEGVKNAIEVGVRLRAEGHPLIGVRIDSGDLAYLSRRARELLDSAGFTNTVVVASNDLDEYVIESLRAQNAAIGTYGVGTRLVTAYDQPSLGGVYKLSCVRGEDGEWRDRIKLSEQLVKVSTPGIQQVRRFLLGDEYVGDAIYDINDGTPTAPLVVDPMDPTRRKRMSKDAVGLDLLEPVVRRGQRLKRAESLPVVRDRARTELSRFHEGIKRFMNPHSYPAGLEERLFQRRLELVEAARGVGK